MTARRKETMATIKELDERVDTLENEIAKLKKQPPKARRDLEFDDTQVDEFLDDFKRLVLALERFATAFAGPERSFVEVGSREVVQQWLDKLKGQQSPPGLWITITTHFNTALPKLSSLPAQQLKLLALLASVGATINFLNARQTKLNNARTAEVIKQIAQDIFDETSSRVDSVSRDLAALIDQLSDTHPARTDLENAQEELREPREDLSDFLNNA
jgi:chromosome segregation ATPase